MKLGNFTPKLRKNSKLTKILKTRQNFSRNLTKSGSKFNVPEVLPTFAPLKNAQKKPGVVGNWRN